MKEFDLNRVKDSLSPIERKIIPHLKEGFEKIVEKSHLDDVTVMRALEFLKLKGLISLEISKKEIIDLGVNGIHYKKNHLPERQLILFLEKSKIPSVEEAQNNVKLSENEFKVSLGVLKKKALISLNNGKIILNAKKEELAKKFLEEQFIESLPLEKSKLSPEQLYAFESLKQRKNIIEVEEKRIVKIILSDLGEKLSNSKFDEDLIEEITPEVIRSYTKSKKFRRYDINAPAPHLSGGKKHFVNQSIEYAKKIWTDLGFKEMNSQMTITGFWNFDALFTAQDHPVREMQDTFFIKDIRGKLPDKEIVNSVKKAHETGINGSKGWQYNWKEDETTKVLLRTHTTCLSAKTLGSIRNLKDKTGKYFSIGKCFRNETLDWSHGFEFNQTEGIVIDKNANFSNLLGYLKEFFTKMGFSDVKFVPSFFPYTEPSVEIYGFHKGKNTWIEIGGAGIFRPEVVVPLLGEYIPILAWGPGFDRIIMDYYQIKDLREMYANNLKSLRSKRMWIK
jgi:phenylalanyl-tRNA synthetase alpha chain